jgi:enoyl-CoA hydratase
MEHTDILYDVPEPAIARITLNRADTRNAQSTRFLYALNDAFQRAAADDQVKVIVLRAHGPHFSSGHDLREPKEARERDTRRDNPVGVWGGFAGPGPGAEAQMAREKEIYSGFCER